MGADEFSEVHALAADAYAFKEIQGCKIDMSLDARPANGGRQYVILGGVTGKTPGLPLPGGKTVLPVNYDIFTNIVIDGLNGPLFQKFLDYLDGNGKAQAQLLLPPVPGAAGTVMHFAYALKGPPWDFASNPVDIKIQ
jgi:hypothetical protein